MRHQHTQELLLRIEGIRLGRGSGHPSPLEPFPGWLWARKTHPESHGHHSQRAARPLGPGLRLGSQFWAPKWDNPSPLASRGSIPSPAPCRGSDRMRSLTQGCIQPLTRCSSRCPRMEQLPWKLRCGKSSSGFCSVGILDAAPRDSCFSPIHLYLTPFPSAWLALKGVSLRSGFQTKADSRFSTPLWELGAELGFPYPVLISSFPRTLGFAIGSWIIGMRAGLLRGGAWQKKG